MVHSTSTPPTLKRLTCHLEYFDKSSLQFPRMPPQHFHHWKKTATLWAYFAQVLLKLTYYAQTPCKNYNMHKLHNMGISTYTPIHISTNSDSKRSLGYWNVDINKWITTRHCTKIIINVKQDFHKEHGECYNTYIEWVASPVAFVWNVVTW